MKSRIVISFMATAIAVSSLSSCRKEGCTDELATNYDAKAKKDDGSCIYAESITVPTTYSFLDAAGNNTVDYSGQTDRLNQLRAMVLKMKSATTTQVSAQDLLDMYANTGGDGNGNFTFTSSKQLKDKTFSADVAMFEGWMTDLANASAFNGQAASNGQAGVLTSGTSTWLFDANGLEPLQLIEKGLMGAVFMNQALNVYFGSGEMDVDNSVAVDPANGKYYTAMQHHWDEAFGYFGVATNFPSVIPTDFWGKYCNSQNATLNCNADMMNAFLKGRAHIVANDLTTRDAQIALIRREWEDISAYQAMAYIDGAISAFGNDDAAFLHEVSEAYAFAWNLRYAPLETRRMNNTEHADLMAMFGTNFWNLTLVDLNSIKATIDAKY